MKKLWLTHLALFLLLCSHLTACNNSKNSGGRTLRRGLSGEPATLEPAKSGDSFSGQVLMDLYEGLTAELPTGEVIPAAAASWEVADGGRRYTFHVRPTAKWSNGQPLLAKHFIQAWRHVVDPASGSPAADDLRLIAGAREILTQNALPESLGVKALDDRTLEIQLERPAPYFPGLMSHTAAFPILSTDGTSVRDPKSWVSNGPYVLAEWRPGTDIKLGRNDAYWDKGAVHIGSVEYQFSSDENAQYARYRAGQLDITDAIPANALKAIRANAPAELMITPYLGTAYYALNLTTGPLSKSPQLRQALSMAIDRKRLVGIMGFGQAPAYGFVPPKIWNYQTQEVDWVSLDDPSRIAEAKRLYAFAVNNDSKKLVIRVLFNSNPVIKQTAVEIAAMWKEVLGIDTQLEEEEYRVFLETRHDRSRFDIARLAWVADVNDAGNFLDTLRTGSPNNDEGYSNRVFDDTIEDAAATTLSADRRNLLQSAEAIMIRDYPIIPLYHYVSKRLVKPYVKGAVASPLDRLPSKNITFSSK